MPTFHTPLRRCTLAVALATSLCAPAFAIINSPVPASAYITQGGLDWAWAFPLPAASGLDLTYQSTQGWRIPTATELASAPNAADFLKAGGNVPFNGTDPVSGAVFGATNAAYTAAASAGACAVPYFGNGWNNCDWQDGNGQRYQPWAGLPGAQSFADQLVVRSAQAVAAPVPVPLWGPLGLALASAGVGLAGMFAARRRKSA